MSEDDDDTTMPDEDGAGDDVTSFDAFTDLDESFEPSPLNRTIAEDGLPAPQVANVLDEAVAPPYTEEMFVCKRDDRYWVERDGRGLITAFSTEQAVVASLEGGRPVYQLPSSAMKECEKPVLTMKEALAGGIRTSAGVRVVADRVKVTPLREQCEFLGERLTPPTPGEAASGYVKFGHMQRFCMAQVSTKGAWLSLTDGAVSSCSIRRPYDVESGEIINRANRAKADLSRHREYHPMFKEAPSKAPAEKTALDEFNEGMMKEQEDVRRAERDDASD